MNSWKSALSFALCGCMALAGCPLDEPTSEPVAGRAAGGGGSGGYGGEAAEADAIRRELDEAAIKPTLPSPPDPKTLCTLRFTNADDEIAGSSMVESKKIIGSDGVEAQSKSEAGLQYRFSDGTGISLHFTWRDGFKGAYGTNNHKAPPDYYLEGGDVQGMPYPACWPHHDPSDD